MNGWKVTLEKGSDSDQFNEIHTKYINGHPYYCSVRPEEETSYSFSLFVGMNYRSSDEEELSERLKALLVKKFVSHSPTDEGYWGVLFRVSTLWEAMELLEGIKDFLEDVDFSER
jgi:hypothetical protein